MANRLKPMTLEQMQFVYTEINDIQYGICVLANIVGPCFGHDWCDKFVKVSRKVHAELPGIEDKFLANASSSDWTNFQNWSHSFKPKTLGDVPQSEHRLKPMPKETMKHVYDELRSFEHRLSEIGNIVGACFGAAMIDRFIKLNRKHMWTLADRLGIAWLEKHGLLGVWSERIQLEEQPNN